MKPIVYCSPKNVVTILRTCVPYPLLLLLALPCINGIVGCSPSGSNESSAKPRQIGDKQSRTASPPNVPTRSEQKVLADVAPFAVASSAESIEQEDFDNADIKILFIGNSHTLTSPEQLGKLFQLLAPAKRVLIARSSGGFLAEHAKSERTLKLLRFGDWDYVILQAQKYSTSGKYHYPIDGAVQLANKAKNKNAKVIMFPEWSLQGKPDEHLRINKLHNEIAAKTGATVAPIGQAWTLVGKQKPDLALYSMDGNHASTVGHFINACVFFQLITGSSPKLSSNNAESSASTYPIEDSIAKITSQCVRDAGSIKKD